MLSYPVVPATYFEIGGWNRFVAHGFHGVCTRVNVPLRSGAAMRLLTMYCDSSNVSCLLAEKEMLKCSLH